MKNYGYNLSIYDYIIQNGQLDNLKCVMSPEINCCWDKLTCNNVAWKNNWRKNIHVNVSIRLDILKWLHAKGCKFCAKLCEYAAENGYLPILKWVDTIIPIKIGSHSDEIEYPWNKNACALAVSNNHFDILKWLYENGCPLDIKTSVGAALNGNLDILKWFRTEFNENNCPRGRDETTCSSAASNGNLDILKYLRKNNCPRGRDESTCISAAENGYLNILIWARKNGCKWSREVCKRAKNNKYHHVLEWTCKNGCECDGDYHMIET